MAHSGEPGSYLKHDTQNGLLLWLVLYQHTIIYNYVFITSMPKSRFLVQKYCLFLLWTCLNVKEKYTILQNVTQSVCCSNELIEHDISKYFSCTMFKYINNVFYYITILQIYSILNKNTTHFEPGTSTY